MCVILTKGNRVSRAIFALYSEYMVCHPNPHSPSNQKLWLLRVPDWVAPPPGALSSAKESFRPCPRFGASLLHAWLLHSDGCIHLAPTWNHIWSSSAPPESRLSQHGSWVLPSRFFHSSSQALFLGVHPPISKFQHLFSREFDAGHTHLFKDAGNCDAT